MSERKFTDDFGTKFIRFKLFIIENKTLFLISCGIVGSIFIFVLWSHIYANSHECLVKITSKTRLILDKKGTQVPLTFIKRHWLCIFHDMFRTMIEIWIWVHIAPMIGAYIAGIITVKRL